MARAGDAPRTFSVSLEARVKETQTEVRPGCFGPLFEGRLLASAQSPVQFFFQTAAARVPYFPSANCRAGP